MTANVLVLAGMLAVMLWLDPRLAVLALLPLPLLALMTLRSSAPHPPGQPAPARRRRRAGSHRGGVDGGDPHGAVAGDRGLAGQPLRGQRAAQPARGACSASGWPPASSAASSCWWPWPPRWVLWQGARLVLQGGLTPGDLIVFLSYLKNTFRPVREHAKHTARLSKALAAAERIADVLDEIPEVQDPARCRRGAAAGGRDPLRRRALRLRRRAAGARRAEPVRCRGGAGRHRRRLRAPASRRWSACCCGCTNRSPAR